MRRTLPILTMLTLVIMACSTFKFAQEPTATPEPPPTEVPTLTPTETATPTQPPTATPPPQDFGPNNFPPNVNPLTGLPVSDPARLERRPASVKIQMFPRDDRPPFALSLADIVFDYYQNNGLTRFNAIFLSNDAEQVGPIRSARLLDLEIMRMYKNVFAFGGADKKILKQLLNSEVSDLLVFEGAANCPPMCRVDPNGANYLLANTKEMGPYVAKNGVSNTRQALDGMKFQFQAPPNGQPGLQLFARYSISAYTRWDYDAATGRYLRFQDTQEDGGQGEAYAPLMDRVTNQQIAADNVVVILVPHSYFYRSGNSEIIEIKLQDNGTAIAFRDGQSYELRWTRTTADSILSLTFADGTPYSYKPGTTFYQMMGVSSILERKDGGIWRFDIRFP